MSQNSDRVLGRLEEFKDWATGEFTALRVGQNKIIHQIEIINQARWVAYGKIAILNSIVMLGLEMFFRTL